MLVRSSIGTSWPGQEKSISFGGRGHGVMGSSPVALRQVYADELSEKVEKRFVTDASPEGRMFVNSGAGGFG